MGVKSQSLSTGKHMDAHSPHQKTSKESKAMIQNFQHQSYEHFKGVVQDARNLTDDEVNAVAQGQFMTGKEAKSIGLVDELGSYTDAVSAMEDELGIENAELIVVGRSTPRNPLRVLFKAISQLL